MMPGIPRSGNRLAQSRLHSPCFQVAWYEPTESRERRWQHILMLYMTANKGENKPASTERQIMPNLSRPPLYLNIPIVKENFNVT
jgi:hypothetical protein